MDVVPERVGRNEAIFREVNERIRTVGEPRERDDPLELVCECSDTSCTAQVSVTAGAYEAVRGHPRRFIVVPEHVLPEAEREVERVGTFAVVEKIAEAGVVADETDPRNGADDRPSA